MLWAWYWLIYASFGDAPVTWFEVCYEYFVHMTSLLILDFIWLGSKLANVLCWCCCFTLAETVSTFKLVMLVPTNPWAICIRCHDIICSLLCVLWCHALGCYINFLYLVPFLLSSCHHINSAHVYVPMLWSCFFALIILV